MVDEPGEDLLRSHFVLRAGMSLGHSLSPSLLAQRPSRLHFSIRTQCLLWYRSPNIAGLGALIARTELWTPRLPAS